MFMKRKLLAVALPVMLISKVVCSKDNAEKRRLIVYK